MRTISRITADILIAVLTATSGFWVDVNVGTRIFIAIMVGLAMETLFWWLDTIGQDKLADRIRKNRDNIMRNWK